MPIKLDFLGLARPSLHLAVDYLLERYATGDVLDLSEIVVVVPGGRAGRRLLEILVQTAAERSLLLTPPSIETVGQLPEQLYQPQRPFATDFVQQLAWARVLREADRQELGQILAAPTEGGDARWLEYGRMLSRLHTELAADGLDFQDVVRGGEKLDAFAERDRWMQLRRLQESYLALLDNLELWDIQTARLVAVQLRECRCRRDLILVGTVDMTLTLRRMLDQVADRVTALVFAPPDWSGRFDQHGCLISGEWENVELPVRDEQIHVVEGAPEQADRVARCLAGFDARYASDEIAIGLADESIAPLVQRQLAQCGIASRAAAGVPVSRTAPFRLLAAVEAYLRSGGYSQFAALVRHPDISALIERQGLRGSWLDDLDRYYSEHLPSVLGGAHLSEDVSPSVHAVHEIIERGVADFQGPPRPLEQWSEAVRGVLRSVYGYRAWNRDDPAERLLIRVLKEIQKTLEEFSGTIPPDLMPTVAAADGLRLLAEQLQVAAIAPPSDPQAVELLGWLELPLDDAPALIVCGLNEGYVPSSLNADLFLPDALRSRLGLQDNTRRYARDAYALSTLLATRQHCELIAARRNADGDPLVPSRLLFATDRETLARRALRLFTPPAPVAALPPLAGTLVAPLERPDFQLPRPLPLEQPIRDLRVTAFRDYLACPYRFYLRHVLHLRTVDDASDELDGAFFGNLLHEVMRDFGGSAYRDSTDADEIFAALEQALDLHVAEVFGARPLATVGVQIDQLRQRLRAFAEVQAPWAAQGWRIDRIEQPSPEDPGAEFDVDGQPIRLRGRIDRIDVNRDTGEQLILDYKSSDAGKAPDAVHRKAGQWVDLQLPLYRHLAESLGLSGPVRLGYILLPKDVSCVRFELADWTSDELDEADETARGVVRAIRQELFWPPACPPPSYSEDFAAICQDRVLDKPSLVPGTPCELSNEISLADSCD